MSPPSAERGCPRQEAPSRTSATKSGPIVSRVGTCPLSVDLAACSRRDFQLYLEGYRQGYVHGVDRGRAQADEDAQRVHDSAVRVVRAMARLEPWQDAQESRRARWAAAADERAS